MIQKKSQSNFIEKLEILNKIKTSELEESIQHHKEMLDRADSFLLLARLILLFMFLLLISQCARIS